MKEAGKLPHYEDLMLERERLQRDSGKRIISLPVKENQNVPITPENLLNALKSLLDVVNETRLTSFSVGKRDLEELPWRHVIKTIKKCILGKHHTHHHLHRRSNHSTSGSARKYRTRETRIICSGITKG
jgi:hypothetical protein